MARPQSRKALFPGFCDQSNGRSKTCSVQAVRRIAMEHRKVGALMTRADAVVSVREDTRFKDIAALLLEHGISAVPVLDAEGRVAGVVSEADLMIKESRAEDPHFSVNVPADTRTTVTKATGMTARDVMTSPAVTIGADRDAVDAARLMEGKAVKRLPVVDSEGRLAGVISRRDILRVFVRTDEEIRVEVREILNRLLWLDPDEQVVEVGNGVVGLVGEVETHSLAELAGSVISRVDGVVSVLNGLTYRLDDLPGLEKRFGVAAGHAHEV
jgi:CBS domain-containing protein